MRSPAPVSTATLTPVIRPAALTAAGVSATPDLGSVGVLGRGVLGGEPDASQRLAAPARSTTGSGGRATAGEGRRRRVALEDRRGVDARGQRAVGEAAVAGQPRGAERVGDGRRRVAHEQRALQRERHALDDAARAQLVASRSASSARRRRANASSRASAPRGLASSAKNAVERRRAPGHRAQHVEAITLPEPSQIDVSGASRYSRGMPDSST